MSRSRCRARCDYDDVPDDLLSVCTYYEYGRVADKFKERVKIWRERHSGYMKAAKRLLKCRGSIPDTDPPFFRNEPPPRGVKAIYDALIHIEAVIKTPPMILEDNQAEWDDYHSMYYPDGLAAENDPRLFLYHFPPFPERGWLDLNKEEINRAVRLKAFAGGKIFPLPPEVPQHIPDTLNPLKMPVSESIETNELLGSLSWQHTTFINQPGWIRSDDFINLPTDHCKSVDGRFISFERKEDEFGPMKWPRDYKLRGKKAWSLKCCHEQVSSIINWAQSNEQICQAFLRFLRENRPHPDYKPDKSWKRKERLLQLHVYIRRCEGATVADICKNVQSEGLYEDPSSISDAVKSVKEALLIMFP